MKIKYSLSLYYKDLSKLEKAMSYLKSDFKSYSYTDYFELNGELLSSDKEKWEYIFEELRTKNSFIPEQSKNIIKYAYLINDIDLTSLEDNQLLNIQVTERLPFKVEVMYATRVESKFKVITSYQLNNYSLQKGIEKPDLAFVNKKIEFLKGIEIDKNITSMLKNDIIDLESNGLFYLVSKKFKQTFPEDKFSGLKYLPVYNNFLEELSKEEFEYYILFSINPLYYRVTNINLKKNNIKNLISLDKSEENNAKDFNYLDYRKKGDFNINLGYGSNYPEIISGKILKRFYDLDLKGIDLSLTTKVRFVEDNEPFTPDEFNSNEKLQKIYSTKVGIVSNIRNLF